MLCRQLCHILITVRPTVNLHIVGLATYEYIITFRQEIEVVWARKGGEFGEVDVTEVPELPGDDALLCGEQFLDGRVV